MSSLIIELENIPGNRNTFNDFNLRVPDDLPGVAPTDSVLLIGTAIDGPQNIPFPLARISQLEGVFGGLIDTDGIVNQMSLVRCAREVYNAGCRDIRLLRVGGVEATGSIMAETVPPGSIIHQVEMLGQIGSDTNIVAELPIPSGATIDPLSVTVTVSGVGALFGWSLDDNIITFDSAFFDFGAPYYVSYEYAQELDQPRVENETLVKVSDTPLIYQLGHGPLVYGTISVFVGGEEVPATIPDGTVIMWTYDEDTYQITFNPSNFTLANLSQFGIDHVVDPAVDPVTASYNYSLLETGSDTVTGIMVGEGYKFELSYEPLPNTVVVYVDGQMISDLGYVVEGQFIGLKPDYASVGQSVSVEYNYSTGLQVVEGLHLRGYYPGKLYNDVGVELSYDDEGIGTLTITKPLVKGGDSLVFKINDYLNMAKLVEAINRHPANNVVRVSTDISDDLPTVLLAILPFHLTGGYDGPRPSDPDYNAKMYQVLEGAYEILRDYEVDFVVPLDVYADDNPPGGNFAKQLAKACAVASMVNSMTLGIISVKPMPTGEISPLDVAARVDALCQPGINQYFFKDAGGNIVYDDSGNPVDIGRFVMVHAGPEPIFQNKQLGVYAASGAASCAATVSTLPAHIGAVGHVVNGAVGLRYTYSPAQINRLLGANYMVFQARPGTPTMVEIVDGITAAVPGSDYHNLTVVRVVAAAVAMVVEACEAFRGLPNSPQNHGSMATAIDSRLKRLKDDKVGALLDYRFQIIASNKDRLLNRAIIDLTLVPAMEIKQIHTTVTLRPAL